MHQAVSPPKFCPMETTKKDSETEREKTFVCEKTGREFTGSQVLFGNEWFPNHRFHPDIVEKEAKEWEENDRKEKKRQRIGKIMAQWEDYCPPIMKNTDVERLPKEPYKKAMGWKYGAKGMIFHGATGKGKTRTLWRFLHRLSEDGMNWRYFATKKLAQAMSYDFGKKRPELLRQCIGATVLCLDDLGKEHANPQWEADIFEIIDTRTNHERPTIITTNFTGTKLIGKFKDNEMATALVRRLQEFFISIPFK